MIDNGLDATSRLSDNAGTPFQGISMARILTPEQADRAIYFDFEGCKNEAPSLLGWSYLTDDRKTEYVCQSVIEPLLWPAAGAKIPHTAGP